jgi:hypothetical protein
MKKYIILAFGIPLTISSIYSETVHQTWTENFNGTVSFTITPANLQEVNTIFTLSDSSATNPIIDYKYNI